MAGRPASIIFVVQRGRGFSLVFPSYIGVFRFFTGDRVLAGEYVGIMFGSLPAKPMVNIACYLLSSWLALLATTIALFTLFMTRIEGVSWPEAHT